MRSRETQNHGESQLTRQDIVNLHHYVDTAEFSVEGEIRDGRFASWWFQGNLVDIHPPKDLGTRREYSHSKHERDLSRKEG